MAGGEKEKSDLRYYLSEDAEKAYVTGDFITAESLYRQLIERYPEESRFFFNLGSCLSSLGSHVEAIESYKAALRLNPLDADTLYYLGLCYLDCNMPGEAGKFFALCLSVDAGYVRAHCQLAHAANRLGKKAQAIASYRAALSSEADRDTALHLLAALQGEKTDRAPLQYVRSLFDNYARSFEQSLAGIGYDIPRQLRRFLNDWSRREKQFKNVVDLGCGTGLSGSAFRDITERMTGVDLSAPMLDAAREKGIYHLLQQLEIVVFLEETGETFDLFLLTDVLVYLGDLASLFAAMAAKARPGALLLFSIEKCSDKSGYRLQPSGRFAHSREYIEEMAVQSGFSVQARRDTGIRKQDAEWVAGEIYILSFSKGENDLIPQRQPPR